MAGSRFNAKYYPDGPKPPCSKGCADRKAGCAITCQKWLDYVRERNENYKRRLEEAESRVSPANRISKANKNLYHRKKTNGGS